MGGAYKSIRNYYKVEITLNSGDVYRLEKLIFVREENVLHGQFVRQVFHDGSWGEINRNKFHNHFNLNEIERIEHVESIEEHEKDESLVTIVIVIFCVIFCIIMYYIDPFN